MEKKAVAEIRKLLRKQDCRIDRMRACFVDENKEKVLELAETFLALPEEDLSKYCEILSKTLSGRIGRNLFNLEFPLEEERPGGKQEFLYNLEKSELKDEDVLEEFYDRVIEACEYPGKYLILVVHGVYDIPAKTGDGLDLEDASDYVYSFVLTSICPVDLMKEGLCYDGTTFSSRSADWAVQKPVLGFLYPAFNDRTPDIHAALYYAKKGDERYEELAEQLLGCALPRAEKEQKNMFRAIVEESLGRGCDFESAMNITEAVNEIVESGKEEGEPPVLVKEDMRRILEDNGADDDQLKKFDAIYDEAMGDEKSFLAENVADTAKLSVKSANLKLTVKSEVSQILTTKVIDGQEYLLIPVSDDIEVNGIRIRQTLRQEEE
ncbi:MAG: DUF4317 domain-containing protein [Clostridium sp.]|nr:DUF4317 domain-containing protein [Clostridium sp.]